MLGYKTSLNKFKMIESIQSVFFEHNVMKVHIDNRRKTGNSKICGNYTTVSLTTTGSKSYDKENYEAPWNK